MAPSPTSFSAVVFASFFAAGLTGAAVRYGIIEYKAAHNFCASSTVSMLCEVRSVVIVTLMNTPVLGLVALALGCLAVFGNGRALVVAAVVTGTLGLTLYNAGLGACGLLLGALRALRV